MFKWEISSPSLLHTLLCQLNLLKKELTDEVKEPKDTFK